MEFDDQNALDRYLFDVPRRWAQALAKKKDTHGAAAGFGRTRASQLPGVSPARRCSSCRGLR